jgi:RNA polymerase sigma-70 factor (ECF subfamily)
LDPERPDPQETENLLAQIRSGDRAALDQLLAGHRAFMRRVVELRLDRRLSARVDPSDVVQDAQLEAARRIDYFLERGPMPFHLWLRQMAQDRLIQLRRRHLEAECRSIDLEVALPEGSSAQLGRHLLGAGPGPAQEVMDRELARRVREALARLPEGDREILLMRNFEGLTNQEAAQALGVPPGTASTRYGRAVLRLRQALRDGGLTESKT